MWAKPLRRYSSGNACVTGNTESTDFPTAIALQATNKATPKTDRTAFVAELNSTGSALVYSTYLGGSVVKTGHGIAVDSSGNAYVTGYTLSTDFPTVNPFQATAVTCAGLCRRVCGEVECGRFGPGLLHLPGRQWRTMATASPSIPPATPT